MFEARTTLPEPYQSNEFPPLGAIKNPHSGPSPHLKPLGCGAHLLGWLDLRRAPPGGAGLGVNSLEITGCDCLNLWLPSLREKSPVSGQQIILGLITTLFPNKSPRLLPVITFTYVWANIPQVGMEPEAHDEREKDVATIPWTLLGNHWC